MLQKFIIFQDDYYYYYLGPNPQRDNKFHIRPKRTLHNAKKKKGGGECGV